MTTDELHTDDRDVEVLDSLNAEQVYRGFEIRDRYRENTRIRNDVRAKDKAKRLTQSGLFTKIGWGRWQFTGKQR